MQGKGEGGYCEREPGSYAHARNARTHARTHARTRTRTHTQARLSVVLNAALLHVGCVRAEVRITTPATKTLSPPSL